MNVRNPDITGPPTATLSGHRILAQREHIKNASTYPALTGEGGKLNFTIHPNDAFGKKTHGNKYDFSALQPCSTGNSRIPDFFSGWSYNNSNKLVPKGT